MGQDDQFQQAINLIYEAVMDTSLWPAALIKLTDVVGVAQIGVASFDHVNHRFAALAPRVDPLLVASYQDYWAFQDPIWPRMAPLPEGELLPLDSVVSREEYAATAVYNEFHRKAQLGLSLMGAKLPADDQVSTSMFAANPPDQEEIGSDQAQIFKAGLQHVDRAVRIHRELRIRDLDLDTAPHRLEHTDLGVMLVDRSAKVLFANERARELLCSGGGLGLHAGHLEGTNGSDTLQRLIASCDRKLCAPQGPGGEITVCRGKGRPLRVTVTPLRSRGTVAELPWLGLQLPVAVVTISDPAMAKRPKN